MNITDIDIGNINNELIQRVLFSIPKTEFEDADILIIFGCHIKQILNERIDVALNILKSKNIDNILITGGVGVNGNFNESEYMLNKLLEFGISKELIIVENKSTTTEENIINLIQLLKSDNLIKNKKIVLVSSQLHLRRIGMEFKKQFKNIEFNIIYDYPKNSIWSFHNIKESKKLNELAVNEIKKIIRFIKQGIIDDECIDIFKI